MPPSPYHKSKPITYLAIEICLLSMRALLTWEGTTFQRYRQKNVSWPDWLIPHRTHEASSPSIRQPDSVGPRCS